MLPTLPPPNDGRGRLTGPGSDGGFSNGLGGAGLGGPIDNFELSGAGDAPQVFNPCLASTAQQRRDDEVRRDFGTVFGPNCLDGKSAEISIPSDERAPSQYTRKVGTEHARAHGLQPSFINFR